MDANDNKMSWNFIITSVVFSSAMNLIAVSRGQFVIKPPGTFCINPKAPVICNGGSFCNRATGICDCQDGYGLSSDRQRCVKPGTNTNPNGSTNPSQSPNPVCLQPMDPGPCGGHIQRYFFDGNFKMCRPYTWTGCGSSPNNFDSLTACNTACIPSTIPNGYKQAKRMLTIGETCSTSVSNCGGGSLCSAVGVCACPPGTYSADGRQCTPKMMKNFGDTCQLNTDLCVNDYRCIAGRCNCEAGKIYVGGQCLSFVNPPSSTTEQPAVPVQPGQIGTACFNSRQCLTVASECFSGVCRCKAGTILQNFQCVKVPNLGERCDINYECLTPHAMCVCGNTPTTSTDCTCECLTEMGYAPNADKTACLRTRANLNEACTADASCKVAFSSCVAGKCKCKAGFTIDKNTACKPTAEACDYGKPYEANNQVVECELTSTQMLSEETSNSKLQSTCPTNHFCNTYYDVVDANGSWSSAGFCCPFQPPKCPVGIAHASSGPPNFGCDQCPKSTHFCHRTSTIGLGICCPRACASPEDILSNAICYPTVTYGDACEVNEQCLGVKGMICHLDRLRLPNNKGTTTPKPTGATKTPAVPPRMGVCSCPVKSDVPVNGECTRPTCSKPSSSPVRNALGLTIRCQTTSSARSASSQLFTGSLLSGSGIVSVCPVGHTCDQKNGVCCAQTKSASCPGNLISLSQTCATHTDCGREPGRFCYFGPGATSQRGIKLGSCCSAPCPSGFTPVQNGPPCVSHPECSLSAASLSSSSSVAQSQLLLVRKSAFCFQGSCCC